MNQTTEAPTLFHPDVDVRVSRRRKKTVGAHWEGDRIVVVVPVHVRGSQRDEIVGHMVQRLTRHRPNLHASDRELEERAAGLGKQYLEGVAPASIRWSKTQQKRWGSCTPATREIRISERLRRVPTWVLDAVIVHELAHLLEAHHNPRFRELERRYPRLPEADAFLEGYALGIGLEAPDGGTDTDDEAGLVRVGGDVGLDDGVAAS